jgi:hypothetical protein
MPWDCSLNKDLDDSFLVHCALTQDLPNDDVRKFSSSTVPKLEDSYLRLLSAHDQHGGSPSSTRIVQDILKCTGPNMIAIVQARGTCIQGLGNRNGRRSIAYSTSARGGFRKKTV